MCLILPFPNLGIIWEPFLEDQMWGMSLESKMLPLTMTLLQSLQNVSAVTQTMI